MGSSLARRRGAYRALAFMHGAGGPGRIREEDTVTAPGDNHEHSATGVGAGSEGNGSCKTAEARDGIELEKQKVHGGKNAGAYAPKKGQQVSRRKLSSTSGGAELRLTRLAKAEDYGGDAEKH